MADRKYGDDDGDVCPVCRSVVGAGEEAANLLAEIYEELSGNSNYVEKGMIDSFFTKYPDLRSSDE